MSRKKRIPLPKEVYVRYMDGYTIESGGYLWEFCPYHKNATKWGYIQQHRVVVERSLGYYLFDDEYVHHKDHNKKNNDLENLQVVSRSEHRKIHAYDEHKSRFPDVTPELVEKYLAIGGLKYAAKSLGISTGTIRYQFPALVDPYKRRSPANLDSPELIASIQSLAPDPSIGYREASRMLGCCAETIQRICKKRGILWMRKSKVGEAHTKYVRKGQQYDDNPELLQKILPYAESDAVSYNEASDALGIPVPQIQRIVARNGIRWVPKSLYRYPHHD